MWKRLSVGLLFLTACTSARLNRDDSKPTAGRALDAIPMVYADPSFEQILSTLRRARARTVDQALVAINAKFPDYLTHYALVYESLSIQKATYLKPRVIADGLSGRTFLTFNDENADGGRGAFETLTYDKDHHAQFREIAFDAETPADEVLLDDEIDRKLSYPGVKVSKANIGKCTQCHTDHHPIWANYQVWPGVYGSFDDNLFRLNHATSGRHTFEPTGTNGNIEFIKYAEYERNRSGRYLRLQPIETAPMPPGLNDDIAYRRNLKILKELTLEIYGELADDIARLDLPSPRLKKLVLTLKCGFPARAAAQDVLYTTIKEDGAASLEILHQMRRLFPGATFVPDEYVAYNSPDQFRGIFYKVSMVDAKLAAQGISPVFDNTANLTWRLREIGLDSHHYFINMRRTSIDDGEGFARLGNVLLSRLMKRDPTYWAKYNVDYLNDMECAQAGYR